MDTGLRTGAWGGERESLNGFRFARKPLKRLAVVFTDRTWLKPGVNEIEVCGIHARRSKIHFEAGK